MIHKLMESFDIDASKLAGFSTFDVGTLTVMTKYGDVDGQLDSLEAGFGIDQWAADLDEVDGTRMTVSGHREALAQTLCDRVDDMDNANRNIVWTNFFPKRYTQHLASTQWQRPIWEWVEGHAVESKGWRRCSIPEQMNDQADKLAKLALLQAISGGDMISGDFPFELVNVKVSGERVGGFPCQALEASWGYCAAQSLFSEKIIIRQEDFHLVWWDGVGAASALYPKMYRVWLTKHVSDFCRNNVQLYYWSKGTHSPKCKFCESIDEYTT
jgi:hypothetical protein